MPDRHVDQALELASAEARASRTSSGRHADLHRLGIADQNRALLCTAGAGAAGLLCVLVLVLGLSLRRN